MPDTFCCHPFHARITTHPIRLRNIIGGRQDKKNSRPIPDGENWPLPVEAGGVGYKACCGACYKHYLERLHDSPDAFPLHPFPLASHTPTTATHHQLLTSPDHNL